MKSVDEKCANGLEILCAPHYTKEINQKAHEM